MEQKELNKLVRYYAMGFLSAIFGFGVYFICFILSHRVFISMWSGFFLSALNGMYIDRLEGVAEKWKKQKKLKKKT